MKILVFPGSEVVGGSEITAVDLAAGIRDRGHDVAVYAKAGGLRELAEARGLRVIAAKYPVRMRPSPLAVRDLQRVIKQERPDLVHAYEGYSCTESFYAVGFRPRTPLVGTIYTMYVDTYVPSAFPMIVGTDALRIEQSVRRRAPVDLLLPPVDVDGVLGGADAGFRRQNGVADDDLLAVMVSRFDFEQKVDGLSDAIRAVSALAGTCSRKTRLVIVGDGPARTMLEQLAARLAPPGGRPVVTFSGWMSDPRPAYQAADVVLGMGTSALRAMATGKPCVLVSEQGHVSLVRPGTVELYLRQGFWGVGPGSGGPERVMEALGEVAAMSAEDRAALGQFGRQTVLDHFSLDSAVAQLEAVYASAAAWRPGRRHLLAQSLRTIGRVLRFKVHHRLPSTRRELRAVQSGAEGR